MEDQVKHTVKCFILDKFLPGENPDELTDLTPLITGGILDSVATLKPVASLEGQYRIRFRPHEADVDNLDIIVANTSRSSRERGESSRDCTSGRTGTLGLRAVP